MRSIDLAPTPTPLKDSELALTASTWVEYQEVDDRWRVVCRGYLYALDAGDVELVAFQWHPSGRSGYEGPHLHLGPASGVAHQALMRAHVPTGFIDLADVLRFAIEELGVTPLRDDWSEVLHGGADIGKPVHESERLPPGLFRFPSESPE